MGCQLGAVNQLPVNTVVCVVFASSLPPRQCCLPFPSLDRHRKETFQTASSSANHQPKTARIIMRERITFIQKLGDSIESSALQVSSSQVSGPDVKAVREDRLTVALDELPTELHSLLKGSHELHVRWVSPIAYETVSPLLARLPPGFHLFFTPGKGVDAAS